MAYRIVVLLTALFLCVPTLGFAQAPTVDWFDTVTDWVVDVLPGDPFATGDCEGTAVLANGTDAQNGTDLTNAIQNGTTGQKFCVQDGTYVVSETINVKDSQQIRGHYSDGSQPIVKNTGTVEIIFANAGGDQHYRSLDIRDAFYVEGPDANSGRGIQGGDDVIVRNSRFVGNDNTGIGSTGNGLLVEDSYFEDNGNNLSGDTTGPRSAAGVKSTNTLQITRSVFKDNYWYGVWCDVDCDYLGVTDSKFIHNGKGGVGYELTNGSPLTSGDAHMATPGFGVGSDSHINGNLFRDNSYASYSNRWAAIVVNTGQDLTVTGNDVDGTDEAAAGAGQTGWAFQCVSSIRDWRDTETPENQSLPNYVDGSRNIHITNNTWGGDGVSIQPNAPSETYNLNGTDPPDEIYTITGDANCGVVENTGNTP